MSTSVAVAAILLAAPAGAQSRPPMLLVPSSDSVYLLLSTPPAYGFVVYRREVGAAADEKFARVTKEPVLRPRDPQDVAGTLGTELAPTMRALGATDETQAARRLMYDQFTASVLATTRPAVAQALGERFVDTGVTRGRTYEYRVVFVDAMGRETDRSATGRVRVADAPPPAPTNVHAREAGHDVVLAWNYPSIATDSVRAVSALRIYRRGGSDSLHLATTIVRTEGVPREWRDADVRPGQSYTYVMRAVDVAGHEGPASTPTMIAMRDDSPLSRPSDLAIKAGDGSIRLVWRMSPETRVAGYRVERSTQQDAPYHAVTNALVPTTSPEFTDTSVVYGRQYYYRVVSVDSAGRASKPSNVITTMPEDHTPPAPPSAVIATAKAHMPVVHWAASPSNDVKGYVVYRGDDSTHLMRLNSEPLTSTQFVDSGPKGTGLVPGRTYAIRVSAVDRANNESPRIGGTVTIPDDQPPAAPTAFHAAVKDGREVSLSWASSPSLDVRTYELRRVEMGAPGIAQASRSIAQAQVVAHVDVHQRYTVRDTAVAHGRRYVYELVAVDSAGNRSVAARDSLEVRRLEPPPPTRFVQARAVPGGVEVSWERVVDPELAGYRIYRATTPSGVPQERTKALVSGLVFVDSGARGQDYYTVRAVDRSANESRSSTAVRAPAIDSGSAALRERLSRAVDDMARTESGLARQRRLDLSHARDIAADSTPEAKLRRVRALLDTVVFQTTWGATALAELRARYPQSELLRVYAARLALRDGRAAEALSLYDVAVAHDAADAEAQVGRAEALLALGRTKEALAAATRAFELAPEDDATFRVRLRVAEQVGGSGMESMLAEVRRLRERLPKSRKLADDETELLQRMGQWKGVR